MPDCDIDETAITSSPKADVEPSPRSISTTPSLHGDLSKRDDSPRPVEPGTLLAIASAPKETVTAWAPRLRVTP